MTTLRFILGDQLTHRISALDGIDTAADVVLMAEVSAECTYVRHHAQKIVLIFSAMRHFARTLRARGVRVDYVRLTDPENTQTIRGEVLRAAGRHRAAKIVATEPGEWRLLADMRSWHEAAGVEVEIRDDTRFFTRVQDFIAWARTRRTLRMEFFYREMRTKTGILMEHGAPAGGRWNYDPENRKPLPARVIAPEPPRFAPDEITREVIALVTERFPNHFGDPRDFAYPVTEADALHALDRFIVERLPSFGDWQDAMRTGTPVLFHALLSTSINCGLLEPREVVRRAEQAWRDGHVPINAAEGFIRQILGWREYMRGMYWMHMPEFGTRNALGAARPLPWFYWSGETRMNCIRQVVRDTRRHAWAHHIQRLMVTGNFAMLAGVHPDEVDEWYLVVYADAYQWVEMPNTRGMATYADGGTVGTKPYAGSGAYINRMSDYCRSCSYDVRDATGPDACPFNYLYWDFIARHRERFAANQRLAMPLRTLDRMDGSRLAALRARAAAFLADIDGAAGLAVPEAETSLV